ncbi:MAG: type II toxin-antitoxin system HicA family toxin [Candidatus Micrarchaeota archaeon]
MPSLRPLKPQKLISILKSLGFEIARQRGSHIQMRHPDGRVTTASFHSGEDIGRGMLRKIIKQVGMDPQEFIKMC